MTERGPVSEPVFHILLSLVDGPLHGYGIIQEVEQRTGGAVTLGAGTLYSAIKRMLGRGWLKEVPPPAPGEDTRRRNYGLTPAGSRVVRSEAQRLEGLVRHARAKRVLRDRPA